MKKFTLFLAFIALTTFGVGCSSVQDASNSALDQAKGNVSLGFSTKKVDKGYEVAGHAGTNVFGIEPYGSFVAGIRYNPKTAEAPAPVETTK